MRFVTGFTVLVSVLICTGHLRAQEGNPKSNLSFGVGIPTHPDMDIDQNGLFLGLNYRRNSNKVFNWGIFLLRSSANSELDFF